MNPYRKPGREPLTEAELAAARAAERSLPLRAAMAQVAAAVREAGVSADEVARGLRDLIRRIPRRPAD